MRMSDAIPVGASANDRNRIVAIRPGPAMGGAKAATVEIELSSSRAFPITDALPTLRIGARSFRLSRFPSGKTDRIVFTLSAKDYAAVRSGAHVELRIGGAPAWSFGSLNKP
jgi:hypothetical protein